MCGPVRAEMERLALLGGFPCLVSPINNSYACRAIGALYAMQEGMEPAYLCSCDDDLQFTEDSADILGELDRAQLETGFGVATFNSTSHNYEDMPGQIQSRIGDTLEMGWLDGNSLFIPWDVVLDAGLPDSLPTEPLTYFTEVEYQHRVRALLKRPSVAIAGKVAYYRHGFRDQGDPVTAERAARAGQAIEAAATFWREKYGIRDVGVGDAHNYPLLLQAVQAAGDRANQHLIFGGLGPPDWDEIVREIMPKVEVL